jgi:acetolactate synthase I/III small subunit
MSSYDSDTDNTELKILPYRILSVIVDNKPGVLFRVTNLFRARNFNIESITVGTTEQHDISRMTIAIQSDSRTTDQLVKQLRKLIDIIEVRILNTENTVFRELALIKMKAHDPTSRMEITHFSNIFRAKILDVSKDSMMVEITGTPDKIDAFKSIVDPYGIIQIARTGISALPRGV